MTTFQMEKMLTAELTSLNKAIDRKIMLGLSYAREAREHKIILSRLMKIKKQGHASSFSRFSFASSLFR